MANPARKIEYIDQEVPSPEPIAAPASAVSSNQSSRKIPPPGRPQNFAEAKEATLDQFREALAELAK